MKKQPVPPKAAPVPGKVYVSRCCCWKVCNPKIRVVNEDDEDETSCTTLSLYPKATATKIDQSSCGVRLLSGTFFETIIAPEKYIQQNTWP